MTDKTVFIGANNGGLEIFLGAGNLVAGNIQTAKTFKYVMDTYGIDIVNDTIYTTSSMDFATEYGFEDDDDARILMEQGIKLIEMTKTH
ncbi:MAG: hypothetical protein ACO293_07960 [Nitrosopumilaceae archaeon]